MQIVGEVVVAVVIGGSLAFYWLTAIGKEARHERAAFKEHARANRAHLAAIEAAEDDPSFSPDVIRQYVSQVVALAGSLWQTESPGAVHGRPDAELVSKWARSRQAWLGGGLRVMGKPSVDLLGVVNRDDEDENRVDLRVRVWIHCKQPRCGRFMHLDERWTLGRSGGRWVVVSMGGDPLAGPVLTAPLVPNRSFDTDRLREQSLAELADGQKVGDNVALSELVSADEPPALALQDLSVLDGRFAPGLIAAELAHLVEAWEEAATGSEVPLAQLANEEARTALLRPGHRIRLVTQDAELKSWKPTKLDLSRQPPAIEVRLDVEAVRFVTTEHGGHITGDESARRRMALAWVLELTSSSQTPWRLISSNNPAEAISGWSLR